MRNFLLKNAKWELPLQRISEHLLAVLRVGAWDRAKTGAQDRAKETGPQKAQGQPGKLCNSKVSGHHGCLLPGPLHTRYIEHSGTDIWDTCADVTFAKTLAASSRVPGFEVSTPD